MPASVERAAEIAALLVRTRQHPYEPQVIAEAAKVVAGWGDRWRQTLGSPAVLADLPLSVTGCLLAFAAAIEEDARPELTLSRLEREAGQLASEAAWHAGRAEDLFSKAAACDIAYRDGFLASARAHAECARLRQASAIRLRASLGVSRRAS
jgi:hypothetical protein